MKSYLLIGIILSFCSFSYTQTEISGGNVDGIWTKEGSPYNIKGSIMIPCGSTLTINPGVTVRFQGPFKLLVMGRLLAIGNAYDLITFTAVDMNNGWRGIRFDNTCESEDSSKIIYCNLSYGKAIGADPEDKGGALYFNNYSKAIVSYSLITNCMSNFMGGGIYCINSSPVIDHNTISNNSTLWGGGGIYCDAGCSSVISHNKIILNSTTVNCSNCHGGGGGIYCNAWSYATITNNVISYNTTSNSGAGGGGGIICCSSHVVISDNIITYNNTSSIWGGGGGIYCTETSPLIINNLISNNHSFGSLGGGGGICCYYEASPTISNNVVTNNSTEGGGGAIYFRGGNSTITNNTIANNYAQLKGGALCFTDGSDATFRNCILWGNRANNGGNQVFLLDESSDPSFYFCNIDGDNEDFDLNGNFHTGFYQNNLNSDPIFIYPSFGNGATYDGVNADWSLHCNSPVINIGDPSETYPTTDKAGNPRIDSDVIDMGAFEYQNDAGQILSVSPDSVLISEVANSSAILFVTSTVAWTATSNQSWLTINNSTGPCNEAIKISAEANPTTVQRTALITVSGDAVADQSIKITQLAGSPFLSVSTNALTLIYSDVNTASFDINSNSTWTISKDQSWLTLSSATGSNNATITLSATQNPTTVKRMAYIYVSGVIGNRIIVVTQEGAPPVLTVSAEVLNVAYSSGNTTTFDITSNINWAISDNQDWLTVNKTNGSNNATITVSVMANPTAAIRYDTIIVSGAGVLSQMIVVLQDAATAIKNSIENDDLRIFPNPASKIVFVNNIGENASACILDLKGRTVYNKPIINNRIDISELSNGIYFLHIIHSDKILTKKIIKIE